MSKGKFTRSDSFFTSHRRLFSLKQETGMYVALIMMILLLSAISPSFLKVENILNIIRQISIVAIISVGGFFVVLTGGMDISVGSVAALTGIIIAKLSIEMNIAIIPSIIVGLLVGVVIGFINGFLVTFLELPSFIVTLGTMQVAKGISYVMTKATPISNFPDEFVSIGRGHLGPIPWPVIIVFIIYMLVSLFLKYSRFGTYCYALGGNLEAARLAGIRVKNIKVIVYILGGFFASLGGMVVAARINSGSPQVGSTYIFDIFTAIILGGTKLSGGEGRLPDVIAGCIFVGVLTNGMIQLNIDSYTQMIVQGVVLVIAVVTQVLIGRKAK